MGTGCCSGGSGAKQATPATRCDGPSAGLTATVELAAPADMVAGDGRACTSKDGSSNDDDDDDDDDCCGDDDGESGCATVESTEKVEYCNSNEERCDGPSCLITPVPPPLLYHERPRHELGV